MSTRLTAQPSDDEPTTAAGVVESVLFASPAAADASAEYERLRALYAKALSDNARLREQLAWFIRKTFGQKRERIDVEALEAAWREYQSSMAPRPNDGPPPSLSMQLLLSLIGPEAAREAQPPGDSAPSLAPSERPDQTEQSDGASPPPKSKPRKRDAHGRARLPEHWPVERVVLEPESVPEGARRLEPEISERIAYRKVGYVRLLIVRPKYAVDQEGGSTAIHIAPPADEMIPRGKCDPDMLAHVLMAKWADHTPWSRLSGILARQGVDVSDTTLGGWSMRAEPVARCVVDAMREEARACAATIAIDATTVPIKEKGKCRRGYPWVMVADRDHVLFGYSAKHTQDVPKELLKGYRGYVIADAACVYDRLYAEEGPTESGCWSHARRGFFDAAPSDRRALVGVKLADTLFAIEREIGHLAPAQIKAARAERSRAVLGEIASFRERLLGDASVDPRGPLAKALRYTRNHWDALCRFLDDGRLPISNNVSERAIRTVPLGRKNWLCFGSDEHAESACTWLSLIASAKMHGLNPEAYLRDLFRVLPSWPKSRVLELAPKYWTATRARLDLAQLAMPLGPLAIPPRLV